MLAYNFKRSNRYASYNFKLLICAYYTFLFVLIRIPVLIFNRCVLLYTDFINLNVLIHLSFIILFVLIHIPVTTLRCLIFVSVMTDQRKTEHDDWLVKTYKRDRECVHCLFKLIKSKPTVKSSAIFKECGVVVVVEC